MLSFWPPWIWHLHVFNWNCSEGDPLERYLLSQAVEIWEEYLAQIPGVWALLLEFMPDDRLETLAVEAAALQAIAQ